MVTSISFLLDKMTLISMIRTQTQTQIMKVKLATMVSELRVMNLTYLLNSVFKLSFNESFREKNSSKTTMMRIITWKTMVTFPKMMMISQTAHLMGF